MVISLDKKEFANAIHIVSRFAERRGATLAALSGIAIVVGSDGIKLRATNLETGIDLKVEGSVKSQGVVVIPANILKDVAASLSGTGPITIEHAGDTAVITTGVGKSTVKTLPADDFPVIPVPSKADTTHTLPGRTLSDLLGAVIACASTSTVRPELASVFLKCEGGTLTAAASDSFRLAEKKISVAKSGKPFTALIPARNAVDIRETIPDAEVTLMLDEHQCAFSWEGGVVTTRLVSTNYPDYSQIIPKSFSGEATVLRKDFEAALRHVAIFSDAFQKVRLGFDAKGKSLVLSARNADVGESTERVGAAITGESLELSFNHRYLASPLPLIVAENLTVSSSGIGRPLVIKGAGDASYLYLVMPMNQ